MNCYWCRIELTDANKSKEHIIPNSLGGREYSYNLLCKNHNEGNANSLDVELAKQIGMFADVLDVKRDRPKKNINIQMIDENGKEFLYGSKLEPKPYLENQIPTKSDPIIIWFKNDQELLNYVGKHKAKIEEKYGPTKLKHDSHVPGKRFFINNLSREPGKFGFGGPIFYRGIGKIILNYYLKYKRESFEPITFINFVKGDIPNNFYVNLYYPGHYRIHELGVNEISHILCLRGDSRNKMLYGYVELFNTFNFICLLSDNYQGHDFEMSSAYDLLNSEKLNKKVEIKLTRNHFDDMNILSRAHSGKAIQRLETLFTKIENLQEPI